MNTTETLNEIVYEEARKYTKENNLLWDMRPDDIRDYKSLLRAVNEVFSRNSLDNPQANAYKNKMRSLLNEHRS